MSELNGVIGFPSAGQGDGAERPLRLGALAELVVAFGLPEYAELARTGQHYGVQVASVAPGTALSTTPPLCLWNPVGSGIVAVPTLLSVGYVSGTLGAGRMDAVYVPTIQGAAPTTGNEQAPFNLSLNTGATRGGIRAFSASTVAATPVSCGPMSNLPATAAGPVEAFVKVNGLYIVPPGMCWGVTGIAAAGTSPLVSLFLSWLELPEGILP